MPINKSAFRRYKVIDMLLQNKMKRYPTMQEIIEACYEKLGVDTSAETIQKDIAQMRMLPPDGFDAPILYNRSKGGYEYTNPDFSLLGVQLSDLDIETIKESAELLQLVGGSRVSEKFNNAIEKIFTTVLEEFPNHKHSEKHIQTMVPPPSRGFEHFDLFYAACIHKQPVSFIHYSYKKRTFSSIIIHPSLIKEFENKWYVVGYSEKHQEVRTFGMDRIFSPFALRKKFVTLDDSTLKSMQQDYYGVFPIPNQPKQQITIEASALATNYFLAYPIHSSQEVEKQPHGSAIIHFELIPTLELTRLFLSHGYHVKVQSPSWYVAFTQKLK
jgi:predicted DNA-binding transcriptional regulator YafY